MDQQLVFVSVTLGSTKLAHHAQLILIVKRVCCMILIAFSATVLKVANPMDLLAALELKIALVNNLKLVLTALNKAIALIAQEVKVVSLLKLDALLKLVPQMLVHAIAQHFLIAELV